MTIRLRNTCILTRNGSISLAIRLQDEMQSLQNYYDASLIVLFRTVILCNIKELQFQLCVPFIDILLKYVQDLKL